MTRRRALFLLGLLAALPARGLPPSDGDVYQRWINERAYRTRFRREPHPDEESGIRVAEPRGDVVIPLPHVLNPNWKMVLLTGDDSINAFDNAHIKLSELFSELGIDESIQLSRSAKHQGNGVRPMSVANLEKAVGDLQVREEDGCLIHMTSHGSPQGFYIRGQSPLTPAKLDQILDRACGSRPTVVLVSACYSGIFAEPHMVAPNRIILTAARKDRTSFGCSPEATYTYWDGCLIDHLTTARTWLELAEQVESCIERKESKSGFARSYPQARFGADVRHLEIRQ